MEGGREQVGGHLSLVQPMIPPTPHTLADKRVNESASQNMLTHHVLQPSGDGNRSPTA